MQEAWRQNHTILVNYRKAWLSSPFRKNDRLAYGEVDGLRTEQVLQSPSLPR